MKFSTKSRYALRLVADLAIHRTDGVLRLKDVANRQNITEKYAEQIISMLKHGGLVQAKRGTQGGYTLTKPAAEITIGEILRLTEGDLAPVPCLENGGDGCDFSEHCTTLSMWKKLYSAISSVVDHMSVQDMIQESGKDRETLALDSAMP